MVLAVVTLRTIYGALVVLWCLVVVMVLESFLLYSYSC